MDIKSFSLIIITVAFITVTAGSPGGGLDDHQCIHDKISKKYPHFSTQHMNSEDVRKKRQANDYLPIRIAPFVIMENVTNSSTNVPRLTDPSGELQSAINYFQSILSVIRAPRNITLPPRCAAEDDNGNCIALRPRTCGSHVTVPNEHLTRAVCDPICREAEGSVNGMDVGGVDTDYILYITAVNDEDCGNTTLAYASACTIDEETYRPLAGFINICDLGLQKSGLALYNVMVHELLHAIGFSLRLFPFFIDENGERYIAMTTQMINGEEVYAINSFRVLNYGREYYSCSNLQGVLLENGRGNVSSHWELRTLGDEIMNAVVSPSGAYYTSISNFTLYLLEDSGWYKVNYAVAESFYNYELLWGKGLGCDFITADCDTWPYACSQQGDDGCNYDYQALALCRFHVVSGCIYFIPDSDGHCSLPNDLITRSCFPVIESGSPNSYCYDRQCYRYSSTLGLFYTVDNGQLCSYDGAELTVLGDTLTCPPAELVCSRNTSITLFDSTGNIPPSWCHDSCATCSRPASPAYCLTCNTSMTLRGTAPSVCTADNCGSGTFLDSSGNCTTCATGCRACTGPSNSDCLACEDETRYRVTTNQPSSSACVSAAECVTPAVSTFGDRACNMIGGASSTHYNQPLLAFSLLVYSLYL